MYVSSIIGLDSRFKYVNCFSAQYE